VAVGIAFTNGETSLALSPSMPIARFNRDFLYALATAGRADRLVTDQECFDGQLKVKVVGKTKQAVGEIIGDGKLNEEGKEQARTTEPTNSEPPRKSLGNLEKSPDPT
jgi:hypothetical protein